MRSRDRQPEIMDDPALDAGRHREALAGLARLNRLSGAGRIVWRHLRDLTDRARPLRVLDLATGAGDVAIELARHAQRAGAPVEIDGCDRSPLAVAEAQRRAQQSGHAGRFFELDALNGSLPDGYDAIVCSLFLHHLTDDQATDLLCRAAEAAGRRLVVVDLCRNRWSLLGVWLACRLVTRSRVVRIDGPLSVRAAFTRREAQRIAERAGLRGAAVSPTFPVRWVLRWDRAG